MAKYKNVSGREIDYPPVLGYGDPVKPNASVDVPPELQEQFDGSPAFWQRVTAAKKTAAKKTAPTKKAVAGPPAGDAADNHEKGDD